MDPSSEPPSVEEIAAELSVPLRRYLARHVGQPALAEDLLQETLIRIARGLPGYESRATLKTWAFSIATRVVADYFREPANRARIIPIEESSEVPHPDRGVDQWLVVDEMNACVRQVIDSLPEDYRSALILHDFENLTASQVAEICGCSLATDRARLRLRKALQQECDFYRDRDNVLRCDRKP